MKNKKGEKMNENKEQKPENEISYISKISYMRLKAALIIGTLSILIMVLINWMILTSKWFEMMLDSPLLTWFLASLVYFEVIGAIILIICNCILYKFSFYKWLLVAILILLIGMLLRPIIDNYMMFDKLLPYYLGR